MSDGSPCITTEERLTIALATIDRLTRELVDAQRETANKAKALKRAEAERDNAMAAHFKLLTEGK